MEQDDAAVALAKYLRKRPKTGEKQIFLAEKGRCRGKPISVRAVQKRVEYYARESGVAVTCHRLRHTMATQLLNADADIVSIQELLICSTSEKGIPDFTDRELYTSNATPLLPFKEKKIIGKYHEN